MTARSSRRWAAAAAALLAIVAFGGCASVSGYQKARAKYEQQARDNDELARQYSQEIRQLTARRAAYQRALADEARLGRENAALQQRIATLRAAGAGRPATSRTAPNSGFRELGRSIGAETCVLIQKELGDYRRLESIHDGQLRILRSMPGGSPEYRKEAEIVRAQAVLDVVAEALLTADVPRAALQAPAPAGDSTFEPALAALAGAQDQLVVALNDLKLRGRDPAGGEFSRARAGCRVLLAAIAAITDRGPRSGLDRDLLARLDALRGVAEVAGLILTAKDSLVNAPAPPPGRLLVAQSLKGHQPIARLISGLTSARNDPGVLGARSPTGSEIRVLNRIEWIMTMANYCQADAFKPESYLELRLGEVRPLRAAALEIVASYESAHRGNLSGKAASPRAPTEEPWTSTKRSK